MLPGVIGCIQATEVIKLILGTGNSLMGRLMLYDALEMRFREVKVSRDPECALCGENPSITDFIDYDHFAETGETRPHSDGEKTKESRSLPRPSPRSHQTMSTNGDSCSTPDCS